MKIGRMISVPIAIHAALKTGVHGVEDDYLAKTSQADQDLSDAEIPDEIARDLEVVNAIAFHAAIATAHQNAPVLIAAHDGLAAPHSAAGFAKLTVAETEVFNGASVGAWTDLDLSGAIGAQATLVLLKFTLTAGDTLDAYFRRNGDTADLVTDGAQATKSVALNKSGLVVVATDTGGIVEWYSFTGRTVTIDVVAYIK